MPYVSGWAGSVDVVKATAERVLGASSKLIDRLEVWEQFVTAVRWLARGPRPGLTLATATEEALMGWAAEQAALENGSELFVRE